MATKFSMNARGYFAALATTFILSSVTSGPACATESQRLMPDSFEVANSNLLLIYGKIDRVQASSGTIEILGQTLQLPLDVGQINESSVGQIVAVYGFVSPDGAYRVLAFRKLATTEYVPGTTRIVLTGRLSMIDKTLAVARVGSQVVHFSDALHTLNLDELAIGNVVSFRGVQYSGDVRFFADEGRVSKVISAGQTGSGVVAAGQTGSGARTFGQTGSGTTSET